MPAPPIDPEDGTVLLSDVKPSGVRRVETGPWDPCFGGGVVLGSVTLLGGVPGAGKSTLSLQLADTFADAFDGEVMYVASEENEEDVAERASRLQLRRKDRIRLLGFQALSNDIGGPLLSHRPRAVILDSLPGLTGDDLGLSVSLAVRLKAYATELRAPVILIDHVTKNRDFAGLEKLQHAVDLLLMLELDDQVRVLTTDKNRFGPAQVSVRLNMTDHGLFARDESEDEPEDEALGDEA